MAKNCQYLPSSDLLGFVHQIFNLASLQVRRNGFVTNLKLFNEMKEKQAKNYKNFGPPMYSILRYFPSFLYFGEARAIFAIM